MRVLFVMSSVAQMGGLERIMSEKMNYLAEHGHHVFFATYEQGTHPLAYPLHPSIRHIDLDCRFYLLYQYFLPLRIVKAVRLKKMFKNKLQTLVDDEGIELLIAPTNITVFIREVMAISHVRKIIESHEAYTQTMRVDNSLLKWRKKMQYSPLKRCDLLITLTRNDQNCWKRQVENVITIPNAVTVYPDTIDTSSKLPGRIIAVGRLHPQKRFDRLIRAFSLLADKYPQWYVDIYGDGDDRDKLQQQIDDSGLSRRIHLKGVTTEIYQEYSRSQFFVLSSDYEGFALVIAEAMACGTPCVSTDCPFGPSDIIDHHHTGLLAKMDVRDLADKMEWMMTHDAERQAMGIKAHEAAARYKKAVVMKEWETAYRSVLN